MRDYLVINSILERNMNGESVVDLSKEYGIPTSTLYKKLKKLKNENHDDEQSLRAKLFDSERRIAKLENDNSIYKEVVILLDLDNKKIYEIMDTLYDKYQSKHALCRVFNVARSDYYHHLKKRDKKSKIEIEDEKLKIKIHKIFHDSEQRYGKRKIRAELEKDGITISEKRISRLMQELRLYTTQKMNREIRSQNKTRLFPNKLEKKFTWDKANLAWVSDTTHIKVGEHTCYLCVILDLFSRRVISYHLSPFHDTDLIMKTFNKAFDERGKPSNLIFHSDRGSQYTATLFR